MHVTQLPCACLHYSGCKNLMTIFSFSANGIVCQVKHKSLSNDNNSNNSDNNNSSRFLYN